MNIGVFSKFAMAGGSEMRCAHMCNAIAEFTEHQPYLLCEGGIPDKISSAVKPGVTVIKNVCSPDNIQNFYDMDHILVVNTDSKDFTTLDYWEGKTDRHSSFIDLEKVKGMSFLFNFIVSPARHLYQLETKCRDIRIITANKRFFDEISSKDKHEHVRHLKRFILESPIDPTCVSQDKLGGSIVRIGKHSHALGNKFNEEHAELIKRVNAKHGDRVIWDFMGVPKDRIDEIKNFKNVIIRRTFSLPVKDYLKGIDIYLFYPSWKRQEPWARSVAEGLMSGAPVVATDTDGGNRMQIINGSNGFLCKSIDDFEKNICTLIEDVDLRNKMRDNAIFYSRFFKSETVIKKFVEFISK